MILTIDRVIEQLESGNDPREIARDLRRDREMDEAVAAGDTVLMQEQASLLRRCRAAFDALANKGGLLMAVEYQCGHERNSVGNLRAELYESRPQGVFGVTPNVQGQGEDTSAACGRSPAPGG